MSKRSSKRQRFLHPVIAVFYALAGLSALVYAVAVCSPSFAAWWGATVGAFVRAMLAHLTSWLPFSLAEILLYLVPLLVVAIGILAYRRYCATWRSTLRFLLSLIACVSLLFTLFVFSFGTGYHTKALGQRLGLPEVEVNAAALGDTLTRIVAEVNLAATAVSFGEDGFSTMPYDLNTLSEKLMVGFSSLAGSYDFIPQLKCRVKPVMASRAMSYTHITGVYTYFTGEANINVDFPDYTLPFTAAHELSHQRGIAREDEANFMAFLVALATDDPYICYSAYLSLYEYVADALWEVDREAYREIAQTLSPEVKGELRAYAAFFEPLSDSVASGVSNAVNDAYLKLHGNEAGVHSYNLVVKLAVSYFSA